MFTVENMNIELTTKCPLHCPQCYCNLNTGQDIPLDVVLFWLEQAKLAGVKSVYLSGGETLCYPYLVEVIEKANEFCDDINMAISGILFNQDIFDRIIKAGLNKLSVSLNGSTEEINSITRDGYKYAIAALELLKRNGYKHTIINWVMHCNNIDDFPNVVAIAEKYEVSDIIIFAFKPDSSHQLSTAPSFQQMKQIVDFIHHYKGNVKISIESCYSPLLAMHLDTPVFGNLNVGKNKGCLAGINRFSLSVDGKLSPCRHLDKYESYNSIQEYWEKSPVLKQIRFFHNHKDEPCLSCKYSNYCRPCYSIEDKMFGSIKGCNRLCPVANS